MNIVREDEACLIPEGGTYLGQGPFGIGVFANRDFRPHEAILLLSGDTVDFAYTINKDNLENGYPMQIGIDQYMDLVPNGRYVNHSCNPNASLMGGFVLYAIKDIMKGEEVLFDYSTTMDEDYWTMECMCGDTGCRGVVLDFKYLPENLKSYYIRKGYMSSHISALFGETGKKQP